MLDLGRISEGIRTRDFVLLEEWKTRFDRDMEKGFQRGMSTCVSGLTSYINMANVCWKNITILLVIAIRAGGQILYHFSSKILSR